MNRTSLLACLLLLPAAPAWCQAPHEEKLSYRRPTATGFADECTFTIRRDKAGWDIVSVTGRGDTQLTVTTRYDTQDHLLAADAVLAKGGNKVTVTVKAALARVQRDGQDAQEFRVPAGVIVTSAPDWTDTLLLCRRYDRKRGGKQEFSGLWIHPTQPAQLLKFSIERTGTEQIMHAGKKLDVDRYTIRIRGPNSYVAWADGQGQMLRLVSMPFKDGTPNGLVREGYEKSAAALKP